MYNYCVADHSFKSGQTKTGLARLVAPAMFLSCFLVDGVQDVLTSQAS